jgi:hypothetical protein
MSTPIYFPAGFPRSTLAIEINAYATNNVKNKKAKFSKIFGNIIRFYRVIEELGDDL